MGRRQPDRRRSEPRISEAIKVKAIARRGRKCYVLRWREPNGRWREQATNIPAIHRNRGKAMKAAADKEAELLAPVYDSLPWRQFVERYEDEAMSGLAPSTLKAWRYRCASLERAIAPRFLSDVTGPALSRWVAVMRKDGLRESTIKSYLAAVSAALGWAADLEMIDRVPTFPRTPRARGEDPKARSRPITGEEFDRLLANVRGGLSLFAAEKRTADDRRLKARRKGRRKLAPDVQARIEAQHEAELDADVPRWRRFLAALWLSGLRVSEAVALSWDWGAPFMLDLSGPYPVYRILVKGQKSARDQVAPVAPDFADWIAATPGEQRRGRVLGVSITAQQASRIVSAIGRRAGIVVAADGKTATAHDLRRAFGTRWAQRVTPAVLKLLMRHRNISTSEQYYVSINARTLGAELDRSYRASLGDILGDTFAGDSHSQTSEGDQKLYRNDT